MENYEIKLVVFDFDGVFTDCKFCMSYDGNISKIYNGRDSYGIKLLYENGIKTGIISSDDSQIYNFLQKKNHFNKLNFFEIGVKNKIEMLTKWKNYFNINWNNIAYIGDDLPDIECLKKVGLSACPNDAVDEIKKHCSKIISKNGGNGAVREFVDFILN